MQVDVVVEQVVDVFDDGQVQVGVMFLFYIIVQVMEFFEDFILQVFWNVWVLVVYFDVQLVVCVLIVDQYVFLWCVVQCVGQEILQDMV